jgi:hypothetical protein
MAISNLFASKSVPEHFVRGMIGFAGLSGAAWALSFPGITPFIGAVGFLGVSLVAFRGCPFCWSIGLMNTVLNTTLKAKSCPACNDITQLKR